MKRESQFPWKELGARVESTRKAKGLSQEELASRTQVSRTTISQIETGRQRATVGTLSVIAGALDVQIAQLFGGWYSETEAVAEIDKLRGRVAQLEELLRERERAAMTLAIGPWEIRP